MKEAVRKEAFDKGMVILKNSNDDAEQRTRELLNNMKDYTTIPLILLRSNIKCIKNRSKC
jgi:hypothetical protein